VCLGRARHRRSERGRIKQKRSKALLFFHRQPDDQPLLDCAACRFLRGSDEDVTEAAPFDLWTTASTSGAMRASTRSVREVSVDMANLSFRFLDHRASVGNIDGGRCRGCNQPDNTPRRTSPTEQCAQSFIGRPTA